MVGCSKDDAGDCCGKCGKIEPEIVVAVIPVFGRLPLVKHTVERLYKRNKVDKVICVGETSREKNVCTAAGADFVAHGNRPLARKWNAGFLAAKKYNPKACLFVGSSDWVSDNWVETLLPYMNEHDMVGLPGCYLLDLSVARRKHANQGLRACHWPGYKGEREGESIGIGRMISGRILEKMGWQPFDPHLDHSLDYSMVRRVKKFGGNVLLIHSEDIKSMAISTDKWPNKHKFEDHYSGKLKSTTIDPKETVIKWFPESIDVFNTIINSY
jgi:hypothetical protein